MNYTVNLVNFVGPLDLLLRLIEQRDLDITEISLSAITKDYLYHIEKLNTVSEELNWFSQVASRLLLIKSRILIKESIQDEDQTSDDQLADLTKQLKEYKLIQSASQVIGQRTAFRLYPRTLTPNSAMTKISHSNLTKAELATGLKKIYSNLARSALYEHVIVPKIPIESKLEQIELSLDSPRPLDEIINQSHSKLELIASLLALLELVKRRTVEVFETPSGMVVKRCQ